MARQGDSGAPVVWPNADRSRVLIFDQCTKRRDKSSSNRIVPGTYTQRIPYTCAACFSPRSKKYQPRVLRPQVSLGLIDFPPCVPTYRPRVDIHMMSLILRMEDGWWNNFGCHTYSRVFPHLLRRDNHQEFSQDRPILELVELEALEKAPRRAGVVIELGKTVDVTRTSRAKSFGSFRSSINIGTATALFHAEALISTRIRFRASRSNKWRGNKHRSSP